VLHADRSAVIIAVTGFILRPHVRGVRSRMAGIWRWMKIAHRSEQFESSKKRAKWSLTLSFLATLYPSWRAARLDPVDALRYG